MNRHERRAAAAMAKGQPIDRAVMVHEAGHAVGRFLTAARLGHGPDTAISHIVVHAAPVSQGRQSIDGRADLRSEATTFGPMLSKALEDFIRADGFYDGLGGELSLKELERILGKAREAGLDVDDWFRAKGLSGVLGPMAEARLLGRPFESVWNEYSSETDMRTVVREGMLAGLTPTEIDDAVKEIIEAATQEIERPEVWRAILA